MNMYDEAEWCEDCFECNGSQTLNVKGMIDTLTGEVASFIEQQCKACGWNQLS